MLFRSDARLLAEDAYGILARRLTRQRADALSDALAREGVSTEVMEESKLPELPPTQFIHCLEVLDEGLAVHDPLDHLVCVPWGAISLAAAGSVRTEELIRVRHRTVMNDYTGISDFIHRDTEAHEARERHFRLE